MVTTEQWRAIGGFEGLYEVSDAGRVRNARTLFVLKPRKDKDGYLLVTIWKGSPTTKHTMKVHREVAKAFIPNADSRPEVNHRNGDRADATVGNLEWATTSENHKHAYEVLGRKAGTERPVVAESSDTRRVFDSVSAAGRAGFNRKGVQLCLNGTYRQHGGFKWSYANV